jgi:hypothetical protein
VSFQSLPSWPSALASADGMNDQPCHDRLTRPTMSRARSSTWA